MKINFYEKSMEKKCRSKFMRKIVDANTKKNLWIKKKKLRF